MRTDFDIFALEVQGLQRLRHDAVRDPVGNLGIVAKQFEALLLQEMLKSMRDATPRSGLMESDQMRFHETLMDQQWAQHLAGRGFGLAEQLVARLEAQIAGTAAQGVGGNAFSDPLAGVPLGVPTALSGREQLLVAASGTENGQLRAGGFTAGTASPPLEVAHRHGVGVIPSSEGKAFDSSSGPREFVQRLSQPARAAANLAGIPAELMLAQAALETGWGRYGIPAADGGDSHNLFGIKAGGGWRGPVTTVSTHEYINGQKVRVRADFRVYDSFEEAFADYGRLIGGNPRYRAVTAAVSAEQAARALQAAGYATDPDYADKLIAVMRHSRRLTDSG